VAYYNHNQFYRLCIVDLDNTLIRTNTTSELFHIVMNSILSNSLFNSILILPFSFLTHLIMQILSIVLNKITYIDPLKLILVKLMKYRDLNVHHDFKTLFLTKIYLKLNWKVLRLLVYLKKRFACTTILLSGSLDTTCNIVINGMKLSHIIDAYICSRFSDGSLIEVSKLKRLIVEKLRHRCKVMICISDQSDLSKLADLTDIYILVRFGKLSIVRNYRH